jgi:[ribosomal protein S18]-alanine N-acetyltransferase
MATLLPESAFCGCMNFLTGDGGADTRVATQRPAVAADVDTLLVLDRLCFGPHAWPRGVWWEVVCEPGWTVSLVTAAEQAIAVSVQRVVPPTAHLASLAVHPGWRRRGLAARLLQQAIERASGVARWLALEVDRENRGAVRLYRAHGFLAVRRFLEDGNMRLEMIRRLPATRRAGAPGRHDLL